MTITATEVRQIIREELAAALHPSIRVDALVERVAWDVRDFECHLPADARSQSEPEVG